MRNIFFISIFIIISAGHPVQAQINVNQYLWEYPLQSAMVMDEDLTFQIRGEMQKIIDAGSLEFRPINCRYFDVTNDHYALYHEPGRLLHTAALAYPYLTTIQQDSLRVFVSRLFLNDTHKPWASNRLAGDDGLNREFYQPEQVWGLESPFGAYRPTIQNIYSLWLYIYRTGDTAAVEPYYEDIRNFYNNRVGAGVDPGNLYGSMSAHIGMARLADMFDDQAQVATATNNLANNLTSGLDISYVDQRASQGLSGWNAPYRREYESRQDNWVYRGYIFLNLSPEIGRYLADEVYDEVVARHNSGMQRFPFWWVRQAQYFCRWTGDEGVGIPTEMMGMTVPIERWVMNRDFDTMASYLLSAPLGIADCYWIESAVYALESNAGDQWVDIRNVPFSLDLETGLMIWNGTVSNDWFNPANWDVTRIPNQNDHVMIRNATFQPVIETGMQGQAKNITISAGARLIVRGNLQEN